MSDEELFAAHYLPVMRLCLRTLRDVDDAEDAVQETFRRAVQQGGELHADPLPWLITVAKRVCLDELRRRRSGREALERSALLSPADSAPTDAEPERVVVGHLFVRELLGRLTPAERRVVASRVYADRTASDTAATLGVTSTTTRVLLARARAKLRTYLENTQAAFVALPVLATRSLGDAYRRLLERPWLGEQARTAVLLPAAVLITVGLSPAIPGSPGVPSGGAAHGTTAWDGLSPTWVPDGQIGTAQRAVDASPALRESTAQVSRSGSARQSYSPALVPAWDPRIDELQPQDIAASPDYESDHTVYMLGMPTTCRCTELFRSSDGGATWQYVGAPGLEGSHLVLPSTAMDGQFYAQGTGMQRTDDGGQTFVTVGTPITNQASAAPAWSNVGVLIADIALWQIPANGIQRMIAPFGPTQQAIGPPVVVPDGAGGVTILQPISTNRFDGVTHQGILRCSLHECSPAITTMPYHTDQLVLVPSPDVVTDHTVYAVAPGKALAISRDDGLTFTTTSTARVMRISVMASPQGGHRLLALMNWDMTRHIEWSDDDGATWHRASIDPSLHLMANAQVIAVLGPGRVITSTELADRPGTYGFACSADGAAWRACDPVGNQ
jgi:RNA polymerase sigma-70 factor, ECF subfamily